MINEYTQSKHNVSQMTILQLHNQCTPLFWWNEALWRDNQELLDGFRNKKIIENKTYIKPNVDNDINTSNTIDLMDSKIVERVGAIYCRAFYKEFTFTDGFVPTAWLSKNRIDDLDETIIRIIFEIDQKYLDNIDLLMETEDAAYQMLESWFCKFDLEWMISYFVVEYTKVPSINNGNKS